MTPEQAAELIEILTGVALGLIVGVLLSFNFNR